MNLKLFKLRTNSLIFITTIIVMVLFYLFYFEYYVKTNENNIISTNFRALDQMGINIDKKLDIFIKNAEGLKQKANVEYKNIKGKNKNITESELISLLIDTLNEKGDFNKNIKLEKIITTQKEYNDINKLIDKAAGGNYRFVIKLKKPEFQTNTIDSTALMLFEAPYSKLTEGLQRKDIFDGLIIIRDTSIVYNTMNLQMLYYPVKKRISDENISATTDISLPRAGTIMSGTVLDLPVSNINYKAFLKPFRINNEIWFVIGLIKANKFSAASHSIEPWLIITLSLLLMLIILGLPVIKLKVLSKTEQLDTKNIIDYALFAMLGGAFLTIFFTFIFNNLKNRHQINENLGAFSTSIYKSFNREVNEAYNQLDNYDKNYNHLKFDTTNEYKANIINNILSDTSQYFPAIYPYGDYYFWTDKNGIQSAYLTPINTYGRLSDLSKRDYIRKKDEWILPGSRNKKFRLQSIVSLTSGAVKAAIAKKGSDPEKRDAVAVSTRMYSVINTILPKDYEFCIIDKKGTVWFHSDPDRNLKENFPAECKNNKYLKAAMYSNTDKSIDVKYFNTPYRIRIQHLDNLPLFLIVMYNKTAIKSFQAEVITFTLLFVGISLLVIFLQILSLLLIEKHFKTNFSRNLLIKLTIPIARLNIKYRYLTLLNILIMPVYVIFLYNIPNMAAITAILSLTIILFTYFYRLLNDNETKKDHKKWFTRVNIILFIIVNIAGIKFTPLDDYLKVISFYIDVILIITLAHMLFLEKITDDDKYWRNYTRLLTTILFLMGFIPALMYYVTGYNNESVIRVKHTLLDLKEQKERRNIRILEIYEKVNPSKKRDSIINLRNKLGIYTAFNNNTRFYDKNKFGNYITPSVNTKWDSIFCFIRPFYDKYILENKYLSLAVSSKSESSWITDKKNIALKYNSLTEFKNRKSVKPYYIASSIPRISIIAPFTLTRNNKIGDIVSIIVFWGFIFATLFLFYHLLKFGLFRIFNHNIIRSFLYQSFDKILDQMLSVYDHILLIRQSPSDRSENIFNYFSEKKSRLVIDWTDKKNVSNTFSLIDNFKPRSSSNGKKAEVLITGIDNNYPDIKELNKKLKVLKQLINRKDIKLAVLMQLNPGVIIDHYKKQIEKVNDYKITEQQKTEEIKVYDKIIEDIEITLKNFNTRFIPVRFRYPASFEKKYHFNKPIKLTKDKLINNELNASNYLMHFKPVVKKFNKECEELEKAKYLKSSENKREAGTAKKVKKPDNTLNAKKTETAECPDQLIIDKVYSLAKKYYEEIFSNCTVEEKYILLDLAHDLIINPRNEPAIYSLLNKGLLVRKYYRINLMNKSFHKFLVAKLPLSKQLEKQLNEGQDYGSWQGYRLTLILIIVSLFVFITMANQDFLDNLNRLFVVVGGGIAVVTGIVKLLSNKKNTSKE